MTNGHYKNGCSARGDFNVSYGSGAWRERRLAELPETSRKLL